MIDLNKALLWLAALGLVAAGYVGWRQTERAIGKREAQIATLETQVKALSKTADSLENAFRVDTVRLVKRIATTDTLLQRIIDTAIVHHRDTVTVTREVLIQADSTINACRLVLSECATGWNAEKLVNTALRSELATVKALRPSILSRCGLSAGYGATEAAGRVYAGPSVLAGCRVFP